MNYARGKGDHDFSVTADDMRTFIAILVLSGYVSVPRWRLFWQKGTETYNPFVAEALSRNSFEKIKRYFHCCDNENLDSSDKYAKVRSVFSMLNEKFLAYGKVVLQQELSVDESMVPYFGKHGCKQYIKGKPVKFGYKIWCLCTVLRYLLQFEPYHPRKHASNGLPVGASIVTDLLSELPSLPYKIYADRYFSGLQLAEILKEKGIGYTGTIMTNRTEKCPLKSTKKQPRGSMDFKLEKNSDILCVEWQDNTTVTMISTVDGVQPITNASRWDNSSKKE